MRKKVLILGVSAVQMDAILLLKEMDLEVHACAMAADGPGAKVADYFVEINILNETEIIKYILNNSIDYVYSVGSDIAMPVVMRICEKLKLPHFIPSESAITCNTKTLMREKLGAECYGNLPFEVRNNSSQMPSIPLPFILKPSDSQGQRGVFLIETLEEYQEKFDEAISHSRRKEVIVEKFVDGPELSVNAYLVNGEVKFLLASDRITWEGYTGLIHKHIAPSQYLNKQLLDNIHRLVISSCERLGISDGPVYLQIKIENNSPSIIEITPRLDGCHMWKLIEHHVGINILKLTFEHLIYQDTKELDKLLDVTTPVELEFFCEKPDSRFIKNTFDISNCKEYFFYYNNNEIIRSINGKFEKVGYKITEKS
ncbi:ATP-grasp domain-containing protein [Paenibacillus camelliae]|uniref:ATP-grasp domain-containing protein n=1 Tax=Paenibacillus camelliae TaxID=512410 RepID=UPI00203D84F9|nr:ATP-grasp domain-containing protein [Paenibacillus camelliae]MCM3633963.1 ATP-grasp domain-containing protein [Paenibacillus camelliae]